MIDNKIKSIKTIIICFCIFAVLFWMVRKNNIDLKLISQKVDFSSFLFAVNSSNIKDVIIVAGGNSNVYTIYYKDKNYKTYYTQGIVNEEILLKLNKNNIKIIFEKKQEYTEIFGCLLLLGLFVIYYAQKIRNGEGFFSKFNTNNAKAEVVYKDYTIKTSFKDIGGLNEEIEEIKEIVEYLKDPDKVTNLGGRPARGVLLVGPPGTGKTLLAKAIANEAGVPLIAKSASEFVEMFVGVGASRIRDLFKAAREINKPCIIFIDEIDAVAKSRQQVSIGGENEREQTLNQLLVEMDGFNPAEKIVVIAATNRVDTLDPALLRSGRFDKKIYLKLPDVEGRKAIFLIHLKKIKYDPNLDINKIAHITPGLSGADIANIVNEAALIAAKQNKSQVDMQDILKAIERVTIGLEKKYIMSKEDKEIITYHEAGHAVVSIILGVPVAKISIIARGQALGYTLNADEEEKFICNQEDIIKRIKILYGGYCAEKEFLGKTSNGVVDDIKRATFLAEHMVKYWGMSDIVPAFFGGDDFTMDYFKWSDKTRAAIDDAKIVILKKAVEETQNIIREQRSAIERLAIVLFEKETLDEEEIKKIFQLNKK